MKLTNLVTVSTHFFIQLTKWIGLTDLDEIHDIMEETSAGGFLIKKSVVKAKTQFKGQLKIEAKKMPIIRKCIECGLTLGKPKAGEEKCSGRGKCAFTQEPTKANTRVRVLKNEVANRLTVKKRKVQELAAKAARKKGSRLCDPTVLSSDSNDDDSAATLRVSLNLKC